LGRLNAECGGGDKGMSGEELCRILAEPGFSTREEAGRYSGRGVGMNVVKKTVDSLGGAMDLSSRRGEGTTIRAKLPINLSIIKAMMFKTGEQIHAIPAEYVRETVRVETGSLKKIGQSDVYLSQSGPIPVIRPWEVYNNNIDKRETYSRYFKIIVLEADPGCGCLMVDRILGQQDVVIKSLPGIIRGTQGISGATVLGSGKIAFIWDPRFLLRERKTYEFDKEAVLSEN
jgi:two-component system chemotaxis sensor kinase CheA